MTNTAGAEQGADSPVVVVANRLPVDQVTDPDGTTRWQRSPGGLVTALEPFVAGRGGAWVGWSGKAGEAHGKGRRPRRQLEHLGPALTGVRVVLGNARCLCGHWKSHHGAGEAGQRRATLLVRVSRDATLRCLRVAPSA